ncbi:hypothetical protein Peur_018065 [Populus x canadensis]
MPCTGKRTLNCLFKKKELKTCLYVFIPFVNIFLNLCSAHAARRVKVPQSASSPMRCSCLYMTCSSNCIHDMCICEGKIPCCLWF